MGCAITADKAYDIIPRPGGKQQQHPAAGYPDVAFPLSRDAFTWSQPPARVHRITAQDEREDG